MKISIVVLNWNGKNYLKDCINSIIRQTFIDYELIIVDNNSTDQSIELIEQYTKNHKFIKLIKNNENYGFAKGNNLGIKEAKGEFILILNNDTVLEKNFLENILKPTDNSKVGMVSCKMLKINGIDIDTLGLRMLISGISKDTKKQSQNPIIPCGGAALYRKSMLEEIKYNDQYFDEDFYIYAEDLDLGLRAILKGYKSIYQESAYLFHVHSGDVRKNKTYIQLLGHRNIIWTIHKNFPTGTIIKYFHLILLTNLATIALYFIKLNPILILKLKLEGILNLNKQKRQHIQNTKKISRKEFESFLTKKIY